jgi:thiamine biosynthesis lipoprotein
MNEQVIHEFKRQVRLMGCAFEFIVCTEDDSGNEWIDEAILEVKRIENLLTEFSDTSQTTLINRNAGTSSVVVDEEVYAIIKRAKNISQFTQGAFDITAGALHKLYNFRGREFKMPEADTIRKTLVRVGYHKINLLKGNQVYLTQREMHIGFGAIGKGYAADKIKKMLLQRGIRNGVINASGDLTAWGTRSDGSAWKVGIADPDDPSRTIAWIPVHNASVATSGDYEQYFEWNGERYSHAIDPKSGRPVKGIKSVTIAGPSAELSDALATAVMIMGVEVGLHFVEQLPQTHCLIVDDHNKIFTSRNLKINLVHEAGL